MVLFLIDLVCGVLINCVFKLGGWCIYKSYNGLYYMRNRYALKQPLINDNTTDNTYIILSTEEYERIVNKNNDINEIYTKLETIEQKITK